MRSLHKVEMGKYGIYLNAKVFIFYLKMDYKVLIYLSSLNRKYKTKRNPSRASSRDLFINFGY